MLLKPVKEGDPRPKPAQYKLLTPDQCWSDNLGGTRALYDAIARSDARDLALFTKAGRSVSFGPLPTAPDTPWRDAPYALEMQATMREPTSSRDVPVAFPSPQRLSLALRSEAAAHQIGVLAVCPAAVETPILDKGLITGINGRDFYRMGQRSKDFYDADRLAEVGAGDHGDGRAHAKVVAHAAPAARSCSTALAQSST